MVMGHRSDCSMRGAAVRERAGRSSRPAFAPARASWRRKDRLRYARWLSRKCLRILGLPVVASATWLTKKSPTGWIVMTRSDAGHGVQVDEGAGADAAVAAKGAVELGSASHVGRCQAAEPTGWRSSLRTAASRG